MKQTLLIFTKNAIYGKVKNRLAATVGNDKALHIYQQLLQYTAAITDELSVEKIVFYSSGLEEKDAFKNDVYKKQVQEGNDLGERMHHAIEYAFNQGSSEVIIIGSDCIYITAEGIINAFDRLQNNAVVIGPATDGGYYLLGMKQLHSRLFEQINWSTNQVLSKTIAICQANNLSFYLLPELSDIDTEEDLKRHESFYQQFSKTS